MKNNLAVAYVNPDKAAMGTVLSAFSLVTPYPANVIARFICDPEHTIPRGHA